jgi:hypothetical protein
MISESSSLSLSLSNPEKMLSLSSLECRWIPVEGRRGTGELVRVTLLTRGVVALLEPEELQVEDRKLEPEELENREELDPEPQEEEEEEAEEREELPPAPHDEPPIDPPVRWPKAIVEKSRATNKNLMNIFMSLVLPYF